MHHSLRFYGEHQRPILRLYMAMAKLTGLPLVGGLVRLAANIYGQRQHGNYVLTQEQAERIVEASTNVALGPCSCRQTFHNCDAPVAAEIVVGVGAEVFPEIRTGEFRQVSKEEAKEVLRQCHQGRLVHTLSKCRGDFYAICSCCTCCCVPLRLRQKHDIKYALTKNDDVVEGFIGGKTYS